VPLALARFLTRLRKTHQCSDAQREAGKTQEMRANGGSTVPESARSLSRIR
jgi:hypothetical protein